MTQITPDPPDADIPTTVDLADECGTSGVAEIVKGWAAT